MSTCLYVHTGFYTSPEPHILSPLRDQTNRLDYCIINLFTFVVRSSSLFSSSALLHYSHYYLVTITVLCLRTLPTASPTSQTVSNNVELR